MRASLNRPALVELGPVARRGMAGQVDVQVRSVGNPELLEPEEALAVRQLGVVGGVALVLDILIVEFPQLASWLLPAERCG